jgi:hypothetical protein
MRSLTPATRRTATRNLERSPSLLVTSKKALQRMGKISKGLGLPSFHSSINPASRVLGVKGNAMHALCQLSYEFTQLWEAVVFVQRRLLTIRMKRPSRSYFLRFRKHHVQPHLHRHPVLQVPMQINFVAGPGKTEFPSTSKKSGLKVLELKGREIFQVRPPFIAHQNSAYSWPLKLRQACPPTARRPPGFSRQRRRLQPLTWVYSNS